jgi:hypothetical protein
MVNHLNKLYVDSFMSFLQQNEEEVFSMGRKQLISALSAGIEALNIIPRSQDLEWPAAFQTLEQTIPLVAQVIYEEGYHGDREAQLSTLSVIFFFLNKAKSDERCQGSDPVKIGENFYTPSEFLTFLSDPSNISGLKPKELKPEALMHG